MKRNTGAFIVSETATPIFCGSDSMQPEWPNPGIKNHLPLFRAYRIGPALAYNLCRLIQQRGGREKLFDLLDTISITDYIMLCFGEIDCRAHILLQAEKQKRNTKAIAREAAERYFSVIKEVRGMGFNVIVWNVIPSAPDDVNSKINVPSEYLFHGTCSERNRVTREFNSCLKELAADHDIGFLDFFDRLIHDDGSVKLAYYLQDDIHLSQKAMPIVMEALRGVMDIPRDDRRLDNRRMK